MHYLLDLLVNLELLLQDSNLVLQLTQAIVLQSASTLVGSSHLGLPVPGFAAPPQGHCLLLPIQLCQSLARSAHLQPMAPPHSLLTGSQVHTV